MQVQVFKILMIDSVAMNLKVSSIGLAAPDAMTTPTAKGVTVKESKISRGLVSPARRALKKFVLWPNFGQKNCASGPCPK